MHCITCFQGELDAIRASTEHLVGVVVLWKQMIRCTSNESYGCAGSGVVRISYASCDFTGKLYGYHGRDHYDHDHYYHEGRSDGNNYRSDRPSIDVHF